ncbi:hypothetical protein K488DRAFT_50010 [Vararia minispora EC-137]|uniref:Uncharacterized protein n=1 Tax=Vararia minispora EC-137 TaxID=1314806 RepID=A0ACB8QKN3_9AGAM|nr:hypothetical protein K488DRAFT_50010 [Vararia minispora EC-137]
MVVLRRASLDTLPYDLLLTVIEFLDIQDIQALHLTSKAFRQAISSQTARRTLVFSLLRRCRPLPLLGFQRITDLTGDELLQHVVKATLLERAWLRRTPVPSRHPPFYPASASRPDTEYKWYKVIDSPVEDGVDWLSPITPSYTLCSTKSGRLVCWDVVTNTHAAEWNPGERWSLWKCRIEYGQKMVYLAMARTNDEDIGREDRVMEFKLMRINFSAEGRLAQTVKPFFEDLRTFPSAGSVMNVFLLDPAQRLLATFMWMDASRTIGLFVLADWDDNEYVFVDTKLPCVRSLYGIWSCILDGDNIVIHNEEGSSAQQHVYPIPILKKYSTYFKRGTPPVVCGELRPMQSVSRPFVFPVLPPSSHQPAFPSNFIGSQATEHHAFEFIEPPAPVTLPTGHSGPIPDPFPPPWFPEGANFVRQWWPTLPGVPRVSCSAVLYALHDHMSSRTKYVLSQHYFSVPLCPPSPPPPAEDMLMRKFFVSKPFELVCVTDSADGEGAEEADPIRPRPLLAVDFGFAAWIEFEDEPTVSDAMCLRCVAFPSVRVEANGALCATSIDRVNVEGLLKGQEPHWMEGRVRTLEVPPELDLRNVESLNIDQSQGAVIVSVMDGKIFVLYYQ